MTGSWYESRIDRQIREAQERGEFDGLPGAGKPIDGLADVYDEEWWLKKLVARDRISGAAPASLLLRREREDVLETVAAKKSEWAARRYVEDLNDRIRRAQRCPLD